MGPLSRLKVRLLVFICKKDNTKGGDVEVCKYPEEDYVALQGLANTYWEGTGTLAGQFHIASPAYLLNYFCMPEITAVTATTPQKERLDTLTLTCLGHPDHLYSLNL